MRLHRRWFYGLCLIVLAGGLLVGCARPTNSVLRHRGDMAEQRGDLQAAERHYDLAVNQSPADWRAQYHLGRVRLELDKPLQARANLEKAYSIRRTVRQTGEGFEPELTVIADDLAEALYRADLRPQLVNFLNERVREFGQVRDYIRKGVYLTKIDDPDNALVALKQAQRLDPRNVEVYLALADFYERIGRRDLALTALRRAYGLDPARPETRRRLSVDYDQVIGPTLGLPPVRPQ